jgi:glycosyltransferase involved in cell wall biosynthesis
MSRVQPLRLCLISNPQSIHTRRWVSWFQQRGHTVCLIADAPVKDAWPGVEVFPFADRFNIRVARFAVWALWVKRIVSQWQPDILHAHRVSSAGWIGAYSGFHPFVIAPWGSDLLLHPQRSIVAKRLAEYSLSKADLIIANSTALHQRAIDLGADASKIRDVTWNAVDRSVFHPNIPTEPVRIAFKLGDSPVVLSPRALKPVYNIDAIVLSIPLVLRIVPDAVYLFIKFNAQPDYLGELEKRISSLNLDANIRWINSLSDSAQVAQMYNLSDAIVTVPSSDSLPSTLLEAMACGSPVIASDIPTMRDWIEDGVNGLLVPVGDTVALADATIRLLTSPDERSSMATRSLQVVARRGDYHAEMQKVEDLYYHLLGESG